MRCVVGTFALEVCVRKGLLLLCVCLACLHGGAAASQSAQAARSRFVGLLEARLRSAQPMRLSADRITMAGSTVTLEGHARLWFDETAIRAEEAVLDTETRRVTLSGRVTALFGQQ